jgi:hypothetical protein
VYIAGVRHLGSGEWKHGARNSGLHGVSSKSLQFIIQDVDLTKHIQNGELTIRYKIERMASDLAL